MAATKVDELMKAKQGQRAEAQMDDVLYLEVKRMIASVFSVNSDDIDRDGDLRSTLELYRDDRDQVETVQIAIADDEIRGAFADSRELKTTDNTLEANDGKKYECLIGLEGRAPSRWVLRTSRSIKDESAGLLYSIGPCSYEYCMFIFTQYAKEKQGVDLSDVIPAMRFRGIPRTSRIIHEGVDVSDWKTLLSELAGFLSIKVESINGKQWKKTELESCVTAYEFKYMFCSGIAIRRHKNRSTFFFREKRRRGGEGARVLDNVPRKRFDEGSVDYYRLALSTNDAYVQYVSFYHVLEFYFSKSFKRGVAEKLRKMITKASFDYTEASLYRVACEMSREIGNKEERGFGGERQELKYVLVEYVTDVDELQKIILYHDGKAIERYRDKGVSFASNANTIDWSLGHDVYDDIVSRVYQTRNALMHSKDREGDSRYRPFIDEKALRDETPLVRALAELVIDNAAKS